MMLFIVAGGNQPGFNPGVAHIARMQNYWRGGKDNDEVDRKAAEHAMAAYPDLATSVRANRDFLAVSAAPSQRDRPAASPRSWDRPADRRQRRHNSPIRPQGRSRFLSADEAAGCGVRRRPGLPERRPRRRRRRSNVGSAQPGRAGAMPPM